MKTEDLKAITKMLGQPITDRLVFDEFYTLVKDHVREAFERDGRHGHDFVIVKPNGWPEVTSFDAFVDATMKLAGVDDDVAKRHVFDVFSRGIKKMGVTGFIDVFEAWTVATNIGDGETPEEAHARYRREIDRHGGYIRDVPTRIEVLMLNARWKDWAYTTTWKVRRRDDAVWLADFNEQKGEDPCKEDRGRQGWLHKAVLENVSGVGA